MLMSHLEGCVKKKKTDENDGMKQFKLCMTVIH